MIPTHPIAAFEEFLHKRGLFFQYPARTEEAFYKMLSREAPHMPVPWATLIDKCIDIGRISIELEDVCNHCVSRPTQTCCQHIYFRRLIPFLKRLGIHTLYTPHKLAGEDYIDGVALRACPLYAVNIEDPKFRAGGHDGPRTLLYSFIGAYASHYITRTRLELFAWFQQPVSDVVIENIGAWHLENVVYSHKQNAQNEIVNDRALEARTWHYNQVLGASQFSLCPSGAGPNSIRFWESLAAGAIPVLLSDGMCLPEEEGFDWNTAILIVPERNLRAIDPYLRSFSLEEIEVRRQRCREAYRRFGLRVHS